MKKNVLSCDCYRQTYMFEGELYRPEQMFDFVSSYIMSASEYSGLYCAHLSLYYVDVLKTLYAMGYKDVSYDTLSGKEMETRTYSYIISDVRDCYLIRVKNADGIIVDLLDACNLFPGLSDEDIRETFGGWERAVMDITKGMRGFPTTLSNIAVRKWKSTINIKKIEQIFDCNEYKISEDYFLSDYIRKSYRTGWVEDRGSQYHSNGKGIVFDCNSIYPYVMKNYPLPCGKPRHFIGNDFNKILEYGDALYYYIQVEFKFDIKDGYLPYIQVRGDFAYPKSCNLITSKIGKYDKKVKTIVSKTDWEMINKIYYVKDVKVIDGYAFYTSKGKLFEKFVTKYYEKKRNSATKGERRINKMILNAVSGSLGRYRKRSNLHYDISSTVYEERLCESEIDAPCYIHIASAITSYARQLTYNAAISNIDRFRYSDTDSIHLDGWDLPRGITVGENIGEWKVEKKYVDSRYYKRKIYAVNDIKKGWTITCAGLERRSQHLVEFALNYSDAMLLVNQSDHFYIDTKIDWRVLYDGRKDYDDDGSEVMKRTAVSESVNELAYALSIGGIDELIKAKIPCMIYRCKNWKISREYFYREIAEIGTL